VVFGKNGFLANVRAYYREYTVRTPESAAEAARRIVCGGFAAAAPGCLFYTDDHYASFVNRSQRSELWLLFSILEQREAEMDTPLRKDDEIPCSIAQHCAVHTRLGA
jgi:ribonuclease T1